MKHTREKNEEIRRDLVMTAGYLEKLADRLVNNEEIISGRFGTKRDVRRIFSQAEKALIPVIEGVTERDIFRDITKDTAREILQKMRKYMLYLIKLERRRAKTDAILEVKDA